MDAFDKELLAATQQRSEQWNDIRLGRFTSSEFYKLMQDPRSKEDKAAGKFSDAGTTYINIKVAEVLTGQKKDDTYAYAKEYGKEMEAVAVEHFIKLTGFSFEPIGFVPFGDHAGCSPDGKINGTDNLEVKCPLASENHVDHLLLTDQWDLKRYSPEKYWQVMSALLFTGAPRCHWISFDPRMKVEKLKMAYIIVEPKVDEFDKITSKLERAIKEKLSLVKLLS
jgi:hypothetical protein